MREFAGRKLASITDQDVRRFMSRLDREPISARTVNIHRQVLHAIFEHARRPDAFGLRDNPVAGSSKRPEEGVKPIETFEAEEIRAVADAFDLVAVKDMMGHSKLTTTERYLHSKPRPDDVAKLTTIFKL